MLGEHLPERFHQIRICLFHGITGLTPVKLPAPKPSYLFAIGSAVYRPKNRAVFGEVD